MYRILVFSDSHGRCDYMIKTIENIPCSLVVHLGDNVSDIEDVSYIYPDIKFEYVRGNCDFASSVAATKIIEAEGFRIMLAHGHEYGVKGTLNRIKEFASENNIDCILYGHTHIPICEKEDGILLLNPGSGSYPGSESYGVIEIEDGEIKGCVIEL